MKSSMYFATATLVGLLICSAPAYSQNFGSVAVGTSKPDTITVTLAKAGTVGSVSVRTVGAENLDYTDAGGGSCAVGAAYAAGATCTVNVSFSPKVPGFRRGAVVLLSGAGGAGSTLANTPLSGTGTGPQIVFESAAAMDITPTVDGRGLNFPTSLTFDGFGNLFVTDKKNNRVIKIPAGGGAATARMSDGVTVHDNAQATVVDGAGNLYIALLDSGRIVESPADGSAEVEISFNQGGNHLPFGLTLDASNNLFIADPFGADVLELPAGGGGPISITAAVDGVALHDVSTAFDAAGNLFIADAGNSRIVEIPVGGGAAFAIHPVVNGVGLNQDGGLAFDPAGSLYIADCKNNRIVVIPPDGGAAYAIAPQVNGRGLNFPTSVAFDQSGDLFITDGNNNRLLEIPRGQAPALAFASTAVGVASTDSPQTVQVQNGGNQALTFSAISFPADFQPGSEPGECTLSGILAAGQICAVSINFVPTAVGVLAEKVTLEDNDGNLPSATQLISVSGLGKADLKAQTISFASLPNVIYGAAPISLTATSSSGLPVSYTVTGPANLSSNMLTPTGIGQVTVTASQPGNDVYSPAPSATQSFLVQASSTTALRVVWPQVTVGAPASFRVLVQGIGGLPTGTVTFDADGNSLGQATLAAGTAVFTTSSLPAGGHSITAVYGGDQAHAGSTSSAGTELIVTTPTMQLTAAPNPLAAEASTTVTATIEHVSGSPVPTGKIKFYLNGTGLGTVPTVAGAATWTLNSLNPGTYQVAAQFTGTGGSQTIQGSSTVITVEKAPTIITLGLSNSAPPAETPVTLYGTVHEVLLGKIPGGTASFYLDGQRVGTVPLVKGTASYPISGLSSGWHSLAVQYNGDQNYFVPPSEKWQNWVVLWIF